MDLLFSNFFHLLLPVQGDHNTEEARSRHRYRKAALSSGAGVVAKVVSLSVTLLTVPLTSTYLGSERFGMWLTSSSIVAMFGFADLGLSNGLVNLVADAYGREDRPAARAAGTSAFWMLTGIACLLLVCSFGIYPFVPWFRIFNVHSAQAMSEAGPMFLVMLACFACTLPLNTVASLQNGLQNGLVRNLWASVGSVLSLAGVYSATRHHAGLVPLMFFLSAGPLLGLLFNAIHLLLGVHSWLLPLPRFFSMRVARLLLQSGLMFFSMQIAMALGYQSDNLVVAHVLGASAVASYAVPSRLFNILPVLIGIFTAPMWPAYAHAIASNDGAWIGRTFRRTIVWTGLITTVLTLGLVLSGNWILHVWMGPGVHVSFLLLVAFGVRCILSAYLQPLSFLLNGIGKLKEQAVIALLMAVVNLVLSIALVMHFGVVGAILGTILAEILVVLVPETILARRALRVLRTQHGKGVAF